jgi:hypothetical protein
VAHNLSIKPLSVTVNVKAGATEPLFLDERAVAQGSDDGLKLTIPAYATGIWRLKAAP